MSLDSFFLLFLVIFISLAIKRRVLGLFLHVIVVILLMVSKNTFFIYLHNQTNSQSNFMHDLTVVFIHMVS